MGAFANFFRKQCQTGSKLFALSNCVEGEGGSDYGGKSVQPVRL